MKLFTIILFAITYILMIALPKKRPYVALISAVIFVVSGAMPLSSVFTAIDWNVLLMLAGTMGTVALFIESKMPERMADLLLQKTPNVMWVAVALSVFAGVVSAFVDNVATVLMIAPVALAIAKKLNLSPVALLICIAVSSNLQGAATLVGDTTSIMLGGYANMDFLDFIFMDGKCSIFFAVELGALVTVPVIMFIFRKEKGKVTVGAPTVVEDLFPTYLLVGTVVLLIAASFIPGRPAVTNGLICMTLFLIGLVRSILQKKHFGPIKYALGEIDFETLLLFDPIRDRATGIYVAPRTRIITPGDRIIHPEQVRVARRMIRNYQGRGNSLRDTIVRAESVNAGEQKYIAPNKPNASVHIDSFHDYELCILAKYLRQIPQFASDLDDAFIEEHGLTVLMDVVRSLPPLDTPYVPRDSIVREFVGGSIFQY